MMYCRKWDKNILLNKTQNNGENIYFKGLTYLIFNFGVVVSMMGYICFKAFITNVTTFSSTFPTLDELTFKLPLILIESYSDWY